MALLVSKSKKKQAPPQSQQGPAPRILRIGIVLGGNIIEERLVRKRETVTIGQSSSNTFAVPIEGLPKSLPIFELVNDRYHLHFQTNMDGRISAAGSVQTIAQLKQQGATKHANDWVFPLDDKARGKISVGAMTLLFQFVTPPPLQPRPRLPASVRGTLADRIEPRLAIILTASVLTHFAVGLWAYNQDKIIERPAERIARTYTVDQYVEPEIVVPVIPVVAEEGDTTEAGTSDVTEKPTPTKVRTPVENSGGGNDSPDNNNGGSNDGSPDEAAVAEAIQSTAVVSVLTGLGGPGGAFSKMTGTDQGASLDKSIAHAKGKATATNGTGTERQRGQNTGKIGTDKGTKVGGPTGTDGGAGGGPKVEDKIQSKLKLGKADDLSLSDLDPNAVAKRIRGKYLAGIKRCHQRALKIDPRAQGKVTIRFTVGPTGRVTKASVKGFSPTVDACIKGQASKWRFSAPKDEGKPTSADFSIPLLLKPGA